MRFVFIVLQSVRMRTQEDAKIINDALWIHPEEAVILVCVMRVLDELHLFLAPQPMRKQPELVAEAVKTGAHQIHRRHVREIRHEKRRHLQLSLTV